MATAERLAIGVPRSFSAVCEIAADSH